MVTTSPIPSPVRPRADRLLYLEEVAEMIRKTPAAMRYLVHKGTAPRSAKIGGRRMFRESDVLAWIDAQFDAEEARSA